jgi:hypothetical protein
MPSVDRLRTIAFRPRERGTGVVGFDQRLGRRNRHDAMSPISPLDWLSTGVVARRELEPFRAFPRVGFLNLFGVVPQRRAADVGTGTGHRLLRGGRGAGRGGGGGVVTRRGARVDGAGRVKQGPPTRHSTGPWKRREEPLVLAYVKSERVLLHATVDTSESRASRVSCRSRGRAPA